MQNAANSAVRAESASRSQPVALSDRMMGVALMSLLPALFWTLLAAGVAPMLSIEIADGTLLRMGAGVAVFLAIITAAVTQRAN